MLHCFVNKIEETIEISGDDYNHIIKSLRAKVNDEIQLSDFSNIYIGKIINITKSSFMVGEISKKNIILCNNVNKTLITSIIKNDKMDFLIMKATELGVNKIIIVESDFSVVRLEINKVAKKLERWHMIAKMAAMQSKRLDIPTIEFCKNFDSLNYQQFDCVLMLDETTEQKFNLIDIKNYINFGIVVGCEGGFSQKEHQYLKNIPNLKNYLLSDNILRSETASIAMLSILLLL